jgi:hypothetical protein
VEGGKGVAGHYSMSVQVYQWFLHESSLIRFAGAKVIKICVQDAIMAHKKA